MSQNRTPQNAPESPATKPGQCSAFGCPMWAGIKTGGDQWLCDCHAMADPAHWQDITHRLRANMRLVRACHRAMNIDPASDWAQRAREYMDRIGRPDLAPTVRKLEHPYRDRHTGEIVSRTIEKDEAKHLSLWVQRLRTALFAECVDEKRQAEPETPKQPAETWTSVAAIAKRYEQAEEAIA